MSVWIDLAEGGWVPDPLLRFGIRRLLELRLREEDPGSPEARHRALQDWADACRHSPVAVETRAANEQHYEVPAAFFAAILGRHLKYSCGFWPEGVTDLDASEEAMLEQTTGRAGLADGQEVLELGCGWGSLTLWMASRFPRARVLAVSNSASQREFILARARAGGLRNVEVVTADMNVFDTARRFDRVVSVEMFEHMRNYEILLGRIAGWLRPGGSLFVHVFSHRELAYPFETTGDDNWLGRHFFTGGQMPADGLLERFDRDLVVREHWWLDGTHYARTAEAWLARLDAHRERVREIFAGVYGAASAARWIERWRLFFLACAEQFGYQGGQQWGVSHYRFQHRHELRR